MLGRVHRGTSVAATCLVLAGAGVAVPAVPTIAAAAPASSGSSDRTSIVAPWFVPASLLALRAEVDARWPGRARASDGTIGDSLHEVRSTSHNPVGHVRGPRYGTRGAVHAIDITAQGVDVSAVLRAVIADRRVWYVIHNRTMWSRSNGWVPVAHNGDPHLTHIHVSLRDDSPAAALAAEGDARDWFPGVGERSLGSSPPSMSADQVRALQRVLMSSGYSIPAGATGVYGAQTTAAVAAFQRAQGWSGANADGAAGPETRRRLGLAPTGEGTVATAAPTSRGSSTAERSGGSVAIAPGARNDRVRALQRALIARGHPITAGATGYFGPATQAAVRAFQRAQGWSGSASDGVPGPTTLRRLGL